MLQGYSKITYEEFRCRAKNAECGALSMEYRPRTDESASIFSMPLREILVANSYSVRSANSARSSFTDYNDQNALALSLEELVATEPLLRQLLEERCDLSDRQLNEASVISLRCTGCDRNIIIDGLHRLTRLASESKDEAVIHVTELSGCNWPVETPDFNLVCACQRG